MNVLVAEWKQDKSTLLLNIMVPVAILSLATATLVPIWTSTVSGIIKIAITICVALGLLVGIIIHLMNVLSLAAQRSGRRRGGSRRTSGSSSVGLEDDLTHS